MCDKFVLYEEAGTMVFTADTTQHVRVAYSEGRVWYVARDIASLAGCQDLSMKSFGFMECEFRILRVPIVSSRKKGMTKCTCIDEDSVKTFLRMKIPYPQVGTWLCSVVMPEAKKRLVYQNPAQTKEPLAERYPISETARQQNKSSTDDGLAPLLDMLDQFIIAAVSLRREMQTRT